MFPLPLTHFISTNVLVISLLSPSNMVLLRKTLLPHLHLHQKIRRKSTPSRGLTNTSLLRLIQLTPLS